MNRSKPITKALENASGESASDVKKELSKFYRWMITEGKDTVRARGLAEPTANNYHDRMDQLFRFVIEIINPKDPTSITQDQADVIIKRLGRDEITKSSNEVYSESAKRKFANTLMKYFEWKWHAGEIDETWEPSIKFSASYHVSADKLSFGERWRIRQAAKEFGKLPDYYDVSQKKREQINCMVAQRVGKPANEVTRHDWDFVDESLKVGSLVATTLDIGLTPCEISEATEHWVFPKRNIIKIPTEHASKERQTTELPIIEDTADVLGQWMQERRFHEQYDDTNKLWLNNHGNPYSSKNLNYLIRRLCEEATVPIDGREIRWYSLRHNLGNSIEEAGSLSEAGDQLRHESLETTKQTYNETAIERRRLRLEQINELSRRTVEEPGFNPHEELEKRANRHSIQGFTTTREYRGGEIHVDTYIDNTLSARVDLTRKILDDSTSEK